MRFVSTFALLAVAGFVVASGAVEDGQSTVERRASRPQPHGQNENADAATEKRMRREVVGKREKLVAKPTPGKRGEGLEERGPPGRAPPYVASDDQQSSQPDANEDMATPHSWKRDGGEPDAVVQVPSNRSWKREDGAAGEPVGKRDGDEPDSTAMWRARTWRKERDVDAAETPDVARGTSP